MHIIMHYTPSTYPLHCLSQPPYAQLKDPLSSFFFFLFLFSLCWIAFPLSTSLLKFSVRHNTVEPTTAWQVSVECSKHSSKAIRLVFILQTWQYNSWITLSGSCTGISSSWACWRGCCEYQLSNFLTHMFVDRVMLIVLLLHSFEFTVSNTSAWTSLRVVSDLLKNISRITARYSFNFVSQLVVSSSSPLSRKLRIESWKAPKRQTSHL